MKRVLLLVGALVLVGCATRPNDAAQSIYAVETGLVGAMEVATSYASLPSCAPDGSPICSDPATVTRIQAAAATAVAAVDAAQAAVQPGTSLSAADQTAAVTQATVALAALTNLTSTVRTK